MRCKKHGGGSSLGSESEYDDGKHHRIPMQLWNIAEIEKKGQDAVDIEVLEEASQFMKDGYLMPHPLHKEKERISAYGKLVTRLFSTKAVLCGECTNAR